MQTVRQAIAAQQGEALLDNVLREIERALAARRGPDHFLRAGQGLSARSQTLLTTPDEQQG